MTGPEGWVLLEGIRAFALPHYRAPDRAYHDDRHVRGMLTALGVRGVLTPALALAVWGHDVVYDARRHDNEARSADLLDDWLAAKQAPADVRARVRSMILATRHAEAPATQEEALLVDADLGILGAPPGPFAAYDAAIRREYAHVPDAAYRPARRAVLQGFLDRPRLFVTPEFADLEAQARMNLRGAVAALAD
ncbi:HD domain-containing protein [Deinococcus ficus]|uniref:HD domain-containing protein n=1 Tax=Deinococcus ficus TaxID=317577 RepID=UPI0019B7688D|nr:phosphohydrolase [Deinococcus ficus]GHF88263.1 hypothetical protein GCM10017782_26890 [Deinococcus ficus]